jgi:hypothetical protein
LSELIERSIRESEVIDFKGKTYSPTPKDEKSDWSSEQEFAKDVSAFANHIGGAIVLGVDEKGEIASTLTPLKLNKRSEIQRLSSILTNYTTPAVQAKFLAIDAKEEGFYVVILIPPSLKSPHAVKGPPSDKRRTLRYPLRDGSDTRWLTEGEVSEKYHRRFSGLEDRLRRQNRVVNEGLEALRRSNDLWLYLALVPEIPVDNHLNLTLMRDSKAWYQQKHWISPLGGNLDTDGVFMAAQGRTVATLRPRFDNDDPANPRGKYFEMHSDGATFAATHCNHWPRTSKSERVSEAGIVDDLTILTEMCVLWAHRQVGTWGHATLIAGFLDGEVPESEGFDKLTFPLQLTNISWGELSRVQLTRALTRAPQSTSFVDLGKSATRQDRMRFTYQVSSGLLQSFGLPETSHLTENGSLNLTSGGWQETHHSTIRNWAYTYDVTTFTG